MKTSKINYLSVLHSFFGTVYQSVMADAKKSASDIYKKRKKALYTCFVNEANIESYEHVRDQLVNCIYKQKKTEIDNI